MNKLPSNKSPEQATENPDIRATFWSFMYSLKEFFNRLIDLQSDLDREGTITNIKNNKRMQGANAWLLMCSIMVASIGLNLDSSAVIIGAMLISPLMSPILGIGLSIGINDKETLYVSLRHFGIAIAIALFTSTLYFVLTPIIESTPQIEARTSPTLLDALVAIFGGLAGIISSSRMDKSNAIPGVAIATALMPPLCVSGYGLANMFTELQPGEWVNPRYWSYFLNSFYLFFLNSFFIALTTFGIVRFLRFPLKSFVNSKERFRTSVSVTVFSIIMIIPSAYIMYGVIGDINQKRQINIFIHKYVTPSGTNRSCINWDIPKESETDTSKYLFIEILGEPISFDSIYSLNQQFKEFTAIENTTIRLIQNNQMRIEDIQKLMDEKISGFEGNLSKKLSLAETIESEKERAIKSLQAQIDSLTFIRPKLDIPEESKALFPAIKSIDLTESQIDQTPILLLKWKDQRNHKRDEKRLIDFIKLRADLDTLVVYRR